VIDLLVERSAKGEPWMAHWVGGTGCCWIEKDRDALIRQAATETTRYALWRTAWEPEFSLPSGEAKVLEEIQTTGGPVGISGSPMAIFTRDRVPVASQDVLEAFAVADHIWDDIKKWIARLSPVQRKSPPFPGKRSIEETLEHLGNCFWWYCSRIDDELPEWSDAGLSQEKRADSFLKMARSWCLDRATTNGSVVSSHVPKRYPTDDPLEEWTLAKVIRRQAEHLWEHRGLLERSAGSL
jgi:hypothetical protein